MATIIQDESAWNPQTMLGYTSAIKRLFDWIFAIFLWLQPNLACSQSLSNEWAFGWYFLNKYPWAKMSSMVYYNHDVVKREGPVAPDLVVWKGVQKGTTIYKT